MHQCPICVPVQPKNADLQRKSPPPATQNHPTCNGNPRDLRHSNPLCPAPTGLLSYRTTIKTPASSAGGRSVWCPRAPFRAGALHSVLPIVWLVRRANGQPTGPLLSYAEAGYTRRAPHRPPACRQPYRFNRGQDQNRQIWSWPVQIDVRPFCWTFNNKIFGFEFGIVPDSFRLVFP